MLLFPYCTCGVALTSIKRIQNDVSSHETHLEVTKTKVVTMFNMLIMTNPIQASPIFIFMGVQMMEQSQLIHTVYISVHLLFCAKGPKFYCEHMENFLIKEWLL